MKGYKMSLKEELGLKRPFIHRGHEALLNILMTGEMLAKEGSRVLAPIGITEAQFNVLMLLAFQSDEGRMNQTELGNMLLVNRSNVTGLIDRMEKAGFVRRIPDPDDRRVNLVELTAGGRVVLERARKIYYNRIDEIMGTLPAGEQERLCRIMEAVRSAVAAPHE